MPTFYLYKSDKPEKKFFVEFINPTTSRKKKIYFGNSNYQDYRQHKNLDRKHNYITRHSARENWNNPYSGSGIWSRYLLWGETSLTKSIKEMEKLFGIKIIRKRT